MLPSVPSEEEYEVERILDKRVDKFGFTEYLVKWKNYEDPEVRKIPMSLFNSPKIHNFPQM